MKIIKYTKEYKSIAKKFSCGNIVIDNVLKSNTALDPNFGKTYILLSDDGIDIIGYYNIATGNVSRLDHVGDYDIYSAMGSAVHINYLGVDEKYQHTELIPGSHFYFGDYLLRDCEAKIVALRDEVGIQFITLSSTKEGYHMYHDRNDYECFEEDMLIFVEDSDVGCTNLYKCIDAIDY